MKYRAIVSFSGVVSMRMGEVRELSDQTLIDDLVGAGFIIPLEEPKAEVKPEPEAKPKAEKKTEPKKSTKPKSSTKGKGKVKDEN